MKKYITLLAAMMFFVNSTGFAGEADKKATTHKAKQQGIKPTSLGKLTDPAIQGKYCVIKDTMKMRLNHMEFMKHRRDEATRKGMRHPKGKQKGNFSISGCINCHGWKKRGNKVVALSVKDKEHFCVSCHRYTAISINCFSCHQSKPTVRAKPIKSYKSGSEK